MKLHAAVLLLLLAAGCSGPSATTDLPPSGSRVTNVDMIQVEGYVSARGNAPFSRVVLETDDRNFYVLALDREAEGRLRAALPGRYRAVGILMMGEWDGRPSAHLRPIEMERL